MLQNPLSLRVIDNYLRPPIFSPASDRKGAAGVGDDVESRADDGNGRGAGDGGTGGADDAGRRCEHLDAGISRKGPAPNMMAQVCRPVLVSSD